MKKSLLLAVLYLGFFLHLAAQQSVTRNIDPFKGVKAAEGIDVYLKKGAKESARIESEGTSADNVITEVSGNSLKIHMRDGRFKGKINIKVYVTYVSLDKISVSSAASIFSEETIKSPDMELSASSAGNINVAVEATKVAISASSAGEIKVKGKASSVTAEASSAGEVDAFDLEAESVTAGASSAGSVDVYVSKNLIAQASSGGDVRYRGNPDKSVTNSSSGGSVKKTN